LGKTTCQPNLRVGRSLIVGGVYIRMEETGQVAFGKATHLGRCVNSHGEQVSAEKGALQMSRTMTNLENPAAIQEGDHAQDPIVPSPQGDGRCHQVIGKRKLVIEQVEEKAEKCSHTCSGPVAKKEGFDS
jgi:hypothetical protein